MNGSYPGNRNISFFPRLMCEVWKRLGFPYLHGFWHVLIFLAAYTGVVLFAYFDVKNHHPHEQPVIR